MTTKLKILRLENKLWTLTANNHFNENHLWCWKKFHVILFLYLFVSFWSFCVCLRMQLLFTYKYFLSFTFSSFVANAPFLNFLKTSEHGKVSWCFYGVEKGCIKNKWVNILFWINILFLNNVAKYLLNLFFFSCYDISALVTFVLIKHFYIFSYVSRTTNSLNQWQYDEE